LKVEVNKQYRAFQNFEKVNKVLAIRKVVGHQMY
jgi:hypothetical protein